MPTSFTNLLARLCRTEGAWRAAVPPDWQQGRTAYGGLSTAIALAAARAEEAGLPPLRTAQTAFLGPAAGDLSVQVTPLRRGKSMSFVAADASGEAGPCTRCLFGFGAPRESRIDVDDVPMPDVPGPEECAPLPSEGVPAFMQHFDVRVASGGPVFGGGQEARFLMWVRHRDGAARSGETALLGLADVLPPAFLALLDEPAPAASVTWQADLLTDEHDSEDGWYLCASIGDAAVNGYGGQSQMAWARDGEPVIAARQCVVVFA